MHGLRLIDQIFDFNPAHLRIDGLERDFGTVKFFRNAVFNLLLIMLPINAVEKFLNAQASFLGIAFNLSYELTVRTFHFFRPFKSFTICLGCVPAFIWSRSAEGLL